MSDPSTARARWLLALAPFLWAGNWLLGRFLITQHGYGPILITTLRWSIAVPALLFLVRWREGALPRPDPGAMARAALAGVCGVTGYTALQYMAMRWTSATNGTLIFSANPVVTAILATWLLRERRMPVLYAGAALSMLGVAAVVSRGSPAALLSLRLNPGDALILIAVVLWALYSIIGKRAMESLSPLRMMLYAAVVGLALLIPLAWAEIRRTGPPRWEWIDGAALAYMGLGAGVAAFVAWNEGVRRLGASRAALYGNLLPVFTAAGEVFFLQGSLSWTHWVGGLGVVAGVWLAAGQGRPVRVERSEEVPAGRSAREA